MNRDPHIVRGTNRVALTSHEGQYRDLTLGDLEDLVAEARRKGITSRGPVRLHYNASQMRDEIVVREVD